MRSHHSEYPNRRGFTLIELLVVIAIIAVLAALLLPTLNRAKETAYLTICKNNLHQWGIGVRLYVEDFNSYPIDRLEMGGAVIDSNTWYMHLEAYTKAKWPAWDGATPPTAKVFKPLNTIAVCPAYARLPNASYATERGSYGYNGNGVPDEGLIKGCDWGHMTSFPPPFDQPNVKDADIVHPSDMIAMGDANLDPFDSATAGCFNFNAVYHAGAAIYLCGVATSNTHTGDSLGLVDLTRRRHQGRYNVLFCDSHVENPRLRRLFDWQQDDVLQRWNRDGIAHRGWGVPMLPP